MSEVKHKDDIFVIPESQYDVASLTDYYAKATSGSLRLLSFLRCANFSCRRVKGHRLKPSSAYLSYRRGESTALRFISLLRLLQLTAG